MLDTVEISAVRFYSRNEGFVFADRVNSIRSRAISSLTRKNQTSLGQFFTPLSIASRMSALFESNRETVRLLDGGAGSGVLTAAYIDAACRASNKPRKITATVYELDENLITYLEETMLLCRAECAGRGIEFDFEIVNDDFIASVAGARGDNLFSVEEKRRFDAAILNPPYGKLNADSETSRCLRNRGIQVPNLYAAFLSLAADALAPGGELVAITPRSFCNGIYFKPFRRYFAERMTFRRFHVFDSRKEIFDADVLQENIIFHAVKAGSSRRENSEIIISAGPRAFENDGETVRIKQHELIRPDDPELFIHLGGSESERAVIRRMQKFQTTLADLGLSVSTGKVVDFRIKEFLQNGLSGEAVPLIYPHNVRDGFVKYPVVHPKKFDAVRKDVVIASLFIEPGVYVIVKRFSAKEEKKRITAALLLPPECLPSGKIALENHLNYFHAGGKELEVDLARGLVLYLNSTLLDSYFRQFSGHTQVNAADLRYLKYPNSTQLRELGRHFKEQFPAQNKIDSLIERLTA